MERRTLLRGFAALPVASRSTPSVAVDAAAGTSPRWSTPGEPGWPSPAEWAVLAAALELVRQFGKITYVGFNIGQQLVSELGLIQSKDLTVRGITGSPGVWPAAIGLIERAGIDLTPLVTSVFSLAEAPAAYAKARSGRDIKVHISFP
jgi:threonine dehydrogenase-like Zn-dependent dehydrogenase